MSFKIAFIGAGSIGFTRGLMRDLFTVPEMRGIEVAFTDTSAANLDMVTQLCQRDITANGIAAKLTATTDRRAALKGAKYVFCVARIGGLEGFKTDIEIPLQYGVDQCVGDTLCAGGIMYGQRGIAAILDFCKDIREVAAPGCMLFNYSNPMAMLTWAANVYGKVPTIGLCHGVEGGHWQIVDCVTHWARKQGLLGKDESAKMGDVDIVAAGINHQTWYVKAQWRGMDLVPKMLELFEGHPEYPRTEKVRIDMLRRFGYYSTESNGHLSEYVSWYRKRPEEIASWIDLGCWINGETGGYLRVCTEGRSWFETDFPNWLKEPAWKFEKEHRSHERGSYIIEALETGTVFRGHFNVVNDGCITNLPDDAIVEVPGYVDRNGINIPRVGDIPMGCAAVCSASVSVQRLAVHAAANGDDTLLRQAMMMDPLVGAVCNPPEIWQMVDEMLVAQAQWIPQYAKAIGAAKARLAGGKKIPTKQGYAGAARLHTKTVDEMLADREAANKNAQVADKGKDRTAAAH
ncbi:MAG TPA: alpha-glucosidase/alpha-galactosidase [Planctomycetota bacterium]|nr:alpha-glucosidase/alpha-galactosidase [Planctomycetota bacterium]